MMRGFLVCLLLPVGLLASVHRGDTLPEVREALGLPRGTLERGEWTRLLYDRGEVELIGGVVTRVSLRSVEAQAELDARRAVEMEQARIELEARRVERIAEGSALKARKLADAAFLGAPASYQVGFWEDFARRFPEVSCHEELVIAQLRLAEDLEERRARAEEARRIAELEARVREAEERAAAAESAAYTANRYYGSYGGRTRHPFTLFPVEYRFNHDVQPPYATPRTGTPAGIMTAAPYVTPSVHVTGRPSSPLGVWPVTDHRHRGVPDIRLGRDHGKGRGHGHAHGRGQDFNRRHPRGRD